MKKKSKFRKTRYCKYHNICEKEIDCFKDEYCAWFTPNRDTVISVSEIEEGRGEWNMDQFWEDRYGKSDKSSE